MERAEQKYIEFVDSGQWTKTHKEKQILVLIAVNKALKRKNNSATNAANADSDSNDESSTSNSDDDSASDDE